MAPQSRLHRTGLQYRRKYEGRHICQPGPQPWSSGGVRKSPRRSVSTHLRVWQCGVLGGGGVGGVEIVGTSENILN